MNSVLVDRARQLARETPAPHHAQVFELPSGGCDPQRALEEVENERELHALFSLLARGLAPRQRSVWALHARGVKRPRLARELGVSERVVKRDLERIMVRARALVVERCGGGCHDNSKIVWRFAFGLATIREAADAQLHLLECPSCQIFFGRLGWWRDAAAAAIPVPATHQVDPSLAERIVHKTADMLVQTKQQLVDAGGQAKQQVAAGYTRAVEYTPMAGVRPGAAVGAVAGCLALGGGAASYCVDRGVDPISGLVDAIRQPAPAKPEPVANKQADVRPAAERPPDPPIVPAPPPPAPVPPAQLAPSPTPTPQPAPAPTPPPPPPAEPPLERTPEAVQFGEPTGTAAASSTPAAPAPAPQTPAPAQEGVDLYGP